MRLGDRLRDAADSDRNEPAEWERVLLGVNQRFRVDDRVRFHVCLGFDVGIGLTPRVCVHERERQLAVFSVVWTVWKRFHHSKHIPVPAVLSLFSVVIIWAGFIDARARDGDARGVANDVRILFSDVFGVLDFVREQLGLANDYAARYCLDGLLEQQRRIVYATHVQDLFRIVERLNFPLNVSFVDRGRDGVCVANWKCGCDGERCF